MNMNFPISPSKLTLAFHFSAMNQETGREEEEITFTLFSYNNPAQGIRIWQCGAEETSPDFIERMKETECVWVTETINLLTFDLRAVAARMIQTLENLEEQKERIKNYKFAAPGKVIAGMN